MKNFKYKTSFASVIKCLVDEEKDKILAKASLDNLKSFIPDNITKQIDLLAVAFNSCTPNMGNKNGDMIDANTALEIYKGFINRPINIEHSRRNGAFGHIVSAGFSKYSADYSIGKGSEILEASKLKDTKDPFNLSLAGVLYRLYEPELIKYVEESSDPDSEAYLKISASWELMFDEYDIAIGSKYLSECEIISDEKEVEKLSKYLLGNNGSGKTPEGKPVYRLVKGEVYPVGIGLTENPAGFLAGIYTDKENTPNSTIKANEIDETDNKINNSLIKLNEVFEESTKNMKEFKNSLSQINNRYVNSNSNKFMKVKNIKDLTSEMLKEATASEVQELYAQDLQSKIEAEVKRISEDYEAKKTEKDKAIKAANDQIVELDKSVKDNTSKYAELEKKFNEVNENYNKLVKANEEKSKLEVFSARLQTLDEQFDLTEDEKKIVGDELKSIDSDEAFAKYQAKMDVLLAKSKKVFDPKTKKWVNKEDMDKMHKEMPKDMKASTNVVDEIKKDEKVVTATIPNTSTVTETLADKAKKVFSKENWDIKYRN